MYRYVGNGPPSVVPGTMIDRLTITMRYSSNYTEKQSLKL